MERKGVLFDVGYPHFYEGVSYCWPNRKKDYDALFLNKRDGLSGVLMENLKKYISGFGVRTSVPPILMCKKENGGFV